MIDYWALEPDGKVHILPVDEDDVQRSGDEMSGEEVEWSFGVQADKQVTYAVSAGQLLLVPVLIFLAWSKPRTSTLFLALELLLFVVSSTWDLILRLLTVSNTTFQMQDLALGIVSSLPALSFLMFATALYVGEIRGQLPEVWKSSVATHAFGVLILPLVPISFVGALLGGVLLVQYDDKVLAFDDSSDLVTHDIISIAGAGAGALFLLFPTILILYLCLHHTPARLWYILISLGLFIALSEIALTPLPFTFPTIILRRALRFSSRLILVLGLLGLYLAVPDRQSLSHRRLDSEDGHHNPDEPASKSPRLTEGKDGGEAKEKSGKSKKKKPEPLRIGAPVNGTFRRLSTDATREFYSNHAKVRGVEIHVPVERVVFRTPAARAPILSFAGSIFDQDALTELAEVIRRRPPPSPQPEPLTARSTKKYAGSIYDPGRISVLGSDLAQWPPTATASLSPPGDSRSGLTSPIYPTRGQREPPGRMRSNRSRRQNSDARELRYQQSRYNSQTIRNAPASRVPPGFQDDYTTDEMTESELRGPRMVHPFAMGADLDVPVSAGEDDLVRIRDIPRYRTGDVTISEALPRTNSVRRKPVPAYEVVDRRMSRSVPIEVASLRERYIPGRRDQIEEENRSRMEKMGPSTATSWQSTVIPSPPPPNPRRETDPNLALSPIVSPTSEYSTQDQHKSLFFATPDETPESTLRGSTRTSRTVSSRRPSDESLIHGARDSMLLPTPDFSRRSEGFPREKLSRQALTEEVLGQEYDEDMASNMSGMATRGSEVGVRAVREAFRMRRVEDTRISTQPSEVSVMASLSRLQRDAGIEADPKRLDNISELRFSISTMESEDLTPRANRTSETPAVAEIGAWWAR
ncbi:hypothetical protein TREMEDRAFT_61727 [Tremella mesenterica DSM 1558]|uniref:uncharacterized protein n=1 Tax=Tremella mesenterica (strain ATCC 24925 / CBS 8224 / DSM 1558 / NBRC 9311 / NRRL Y-6157 / RJB 2259-6 / UBC 559-6) TaxID=578456 RepID=UPI0003F48F2B|nr:uncharacterized protein TREMEDRAFT_61727 [Tremella mesenterica DSM 1558]EIW69959.1 hypothetical protein TREMEDRAFT_61727 [Tremella mesenterica DSM 1558]